MIPVVRHHCQHCKKDFRLANRHYCFKNPANRSCPTCANMEFETDTPDYELAQYHAYCQHAYDSHGYTSLNDVMENMSDTHSRKGNRITMCIHWQPKQKEMI